MTERMHGSGCGSWRVFRRFGWLLVPVLLAACAVPAPRPSAPVPSPQQPAPAPLPVEPPPAVEPGKVEVPQPPPVAPAALALARQSDAARASGDLRLASLHLERALRIAPRDPELWHRMAQVRLEQGEFEQAERMAERSLQLAPEDKSLALANWRTIARAREGMGDHEGARRAREEVYRLESGLG